jgi:protein-L-isoaspartate(D-aspartate) O-methyltransferase
MSDTSEAEFIVERRKMMEQIALYVRFARDHTGITSLDERVMEVLGAVPRHEFVPSELRQFAYIDQPLPIGYGKTISQPYIVALMTNLLQIQPNDRILEVGTGLGYHTAILANLAEAVYSVEIIEELAQDASSRLQQQGYRNIAIQVRDGSFGWPDYAPFDKVLVTAAPELIPSSLLNQLKASGKMVVPAGLKDAQQLIVVDKDESGACHTREILAVRFAPLVITH